jgi:outer membrane protein assembly factor BamD (BamD/ComL family)
MPIVFRQRICLLGLGAAVLCCPVSAIAEEPVFEFLRAAQDHGYGEVSIDFLEQLRAGQRMPKELAETLDLELSRSYRVAVGEAFNAAEAEQRLAKAQTHLDKFLKEHPNHAELARAIESWGDIALDRALERLRVAASVKDKAQKEKYLSAARADLEEARPHVVDATARYLAQYSKLKAARQSEAGKRPKGASPPSKKQRLAQDALREAEATWLECRIKSAKIDFYVAQTYLDESAPERKAALEASAKAFDAIFQSYRESLVGLHAHMWHGRAEDALGKDQLALDIYDEVLATAPESRERETGLEPLFAQVQYQQLLVVRRKEGVKELLAQANAWLQAHRTWKKFDGYQGVALEVAKANLIVAAELSGEKKTSLTQTTLAMLNEIGKVRGEHQQEAILLRREHTQSDPQDLATVKTFDEALALGESAAESLDWPATIAALTRALELNSTAKDPKRVAAAQTRLGQARYQGAAAQYADEKYEECLAAAEQIAHQRPDSPQAPRAASLAVSAALSLYARSQDKQAALARLEKIAQETIERWPERAEADDARIALGQASLVRGDLADAIEVFERVNPRSQRYPSAMYLAGQTHWRLYLAAKPKAADPDVAKQIALERDKAEEQLRTSLAGQRKDAEPGKPLSRQMLETQLLLGEAKAEAGQAEQAAELLDPLVQWIQTEKPNPLDHALLRVFVAAIRANLSLGQLPKASTTANLLVELGPDGAQVNGVLSSILKLFGDQWKQAEAAVIEARTAADPAGRTTAEAAAADRKERLSQLLAQLAPRQHNSLAAMIYIADTSAQLGQTDTAEKLYKAILAQAAEDAAFKKANAQALTRIRAQRVGLLRQKKQFAEGLADVDQLIAELPNALEPKMEKGRLLQGLADDDPSRLGEAVAHWTMLRTRLSKATKKPPEYYEVVYNAASCLYEEGRKTKSDQKALQAEQLLNATLVLSPHLNGPEMVAKYKELLAKVRQLQGRPVSAKN